MRLQEKGLIGDISCAVCESQIETIKHIFFECQMSKIVWDDIFPEVRNYQDMMLNLLYENKLIEQGMYFLWTIWNNRNDCLHNLRCSNPISLKMMVINKAREYSAARQEISPTNTVTKEE